MIINKSKPGFSLVFTLIVLGLISSMLLVLFTLSNTVLNRVQRITTQTQALHLAEAGINKATHKLSFDATYTGETNLELSPITGTVDVSVTSDSATVKTITSQSYIPSKANPIASRKIQIKVEASSDAKGNVFSFAVQTGSGGFFANDNLEVDGNIYSNQDITLNGTGASVTGNASAVDKVNLAKRSIVDGEVNEGVESRLLPVVDINSWESEASKGLTYNGDYTITGNTTLGGKDHVSVITGQLKIDTNATITIAGPIWVKGDTQIYQNPNIVIDAGLQDTKTTLISEGQITLNGNAVFSTNKPNAWLMLLSTYSDPTNPNSPAISINTNGKLTNAVLYAYNGELLIDSNISSAQAMIGQSIRVIGNPRIQYSSGLITTNFNSPNSAPSGGFKIIPGSYIDITL